MQYICPCVLYLSSHICSPILCIIARKVEADAGGGLFMGHAYSLLDVNELVLPNTPENKKLAGSTINKEGKVSIRLVKCRNPWGKGG